MIGIALVVAAAHRAVLLAAIIIGDVTRHLPGRAEIGEEARHIDEAGVILQRRHRRAAAEAAGRALGHRDHAVEPVIHRLRDHAVRADQLMRLALALGGVGIGKAEPHVAADGQVLHPCRAAAQRDRDGAGGGCPLGAEQQLTAGEEQEDAGIGEHQPLPRRRDTRGERRDGVRALRRVIAGAVEADDDVAERHRDRAARAGDQFEIERIGAAWFGARPA